VYSYYFNNYLALDDDDVTKQFQKYDHNNILSQELPESSSSRGLFTITGLGLSRNFRPMG